MKRAIGYAAALVAVVALMFVPLLAIGSSDDGASFETATITDYHADFRVDRDGTLHAVETIKVNFPVYKHGIFRFFDVRDPNDPHVRLVPEDIHVTNDDGPDGLDLSDRVRGRYVVARIGDPDITIDGDHTYVIRYTVPGALSKAPNGGQGSLFYWNLVPGGWQMPIEKSTLTATLPTAPHDVRCAVGNGATSGCRALVSGRTLRVTTGELQPFTPVTVQTPVGVSDAEQLRLPWSQPLDPVLGRSTPRALTFGVLALLALVVGWLLTRLVREPDPAFPLMYAPPAGIGPAQAAYVMTERVNDDAFAATILQIAELGVGQVRQTKKGWQIGGTGADPTALDDVSRKVARNLGLRDGSWLEVKRGSKTNGKKLKTVRDQFRSSVRTWARKNGLVESRGIQVVGAVVVVLSALVALFLFLINPWNFSLAGLPFGLLAVAASPMLDPRSATIRTKQGRELWSQLGGFRRVLGTTSSEARFDFSGRRELYQQYVPWAVAFGVADVWAQKYRVEVQEDPPVPAYFVGGYAGSTAGAGGDLGSFSDSFGSSVNGAISAYQTSQIGSSSSSSGGGGFSSGGGGFSGGGGGGGGGGGSW